VLQVEQLQCRYGKVAAVRDLSIVVHPAELIVLIGANGAGKTTTLKAISGLMAPAAGRILFEGKDLTFATVYERIRAGIARSFQIVNLFDGLSVFDNVALSIFSREGKIARIAALADHDQDVRRETFDVLGRFGLNGKSGVPAGGLAQGERKLLDVAVAYALRPKLLFLDEPTSGVSTREKTQIMDTVSSVVRAGAVTAVVIEHDMDVVFRYSDRIVMMHEGKFLADGTPEEIKANKDVANILLGAPLSA